MLKRIVLLSGFTGMLMTLQAQDNLMIPVPGKPYPNPAVLLVEKVTGSELISLSNHKGSPLIVDFFSSTCAACFRAMPKLNKLQEQFLGKMRFILIGKEDKEIRRNYATFKKRFDLKMDIAYDSILHRDMSEFTFPTYVWIDSYGIVKAITGPEDVNQQNIQQFIEGNNVSVTPPPLKFDFDNSRPFLINGNGGDDTTFLSRTLFTIWKKGQPQSSPPHLFYEKMRDSLQLIGLKLTELYNYAYFSEGFWWQESELYGETFPYPVFEDGGFLTFEKFPTMYNYSLWMSKNQQSFTDLQSRFKDDLEFQFGYNGTVEYRLMPYHSIAIRDGFYEKLRSKNTSKLSKINHSSLEIKKGDIRELIGLLTGRMQKEIPFIDNTKIDFPIDINIEAVMHDLDAVKQALYTIGIQISTSVKPMRILILRKKPRAFKPI